MMQTTYTEEEHMEEEDALSSSISSPSEEQAANDVMQALMELFWIFILNCYARTPPAPIHLSISPQI